MNRLRKKRYINDHEAFQCCSCGSRVNIAHYEYIQNDMVSRVYRCDVCGLMFAMPLLLEEISSRQMDSIEDAEMFHSPLLKKLYEHLIVRKEIHTVRKFLGRDTFTALDIGCGTGWISALWKKAGADIVGLEPSVARGAYARDQYGLKIISSYLEDLDPLDTYDVVIMRHVLEHLSNPFTALKKVHDKLKPNGLLVIIVPNIDCIGRYLFGSKWTWVFPSHCIFFNPRSLRYLVARSGFGPLRSYQTPSPLWYPESLLRLFNGSERLRSEIYQKLNVLALIPFIPVVGFGYIVGLSENLTLIARKNI